MKLMIGERQPEAVSFITQREVDSFKDVGWEFDIELTDDQILKLLEKNPNIYHEMLRWGAGDTPTMDAFFEALVVDCIDRRYNNNERNDDMSAYKEMVKLAAITKGYTIRT